jgi:hypothetical protein
MWAFDQRRSAMEIAMSDDDIVMMPATSLSQMPNRDRRLCVPASRRVCRLNQNSYFKERAPLHAKYFYPLHTTIIHFRWRGAVNCTREHLSTCRTSDAAIRRPCGKSFTPRFAFIRYLIDQRGVIAHASSASLVRHPLIESSSMLA